MSAHRTVTLTTMDHGPVTFDEPAWCIGHHWQPDGEIGRNDITHNSVRVKAGAELDGHGWLNLMAAYITWAPFAELVPTVHVCFDVDCRLSAEEVASFNAGMLSAVRRLEQLAAEAIRLRGELS